MKHTDKYTSVWLNSLSFSSSKIFELKEYFTNFSDIFQASEIDLLRIPFLKKDAVDRIIKFRNPEYLTALNKKINSSPANIYYIDDDEFPDVLRKIEDPPAVIYVMGEITKSDSLSISVIGSRKHTDYGKYCAEKFSSELSKSGITIVSGMAIGIDSIAHRAALESNGRTIAVLGNGIDIVHPKRNEGLYRKIIQNGAVLSEYFFGSPPLPYRFPERNRIISGLSLATLVVEAQSRSGSLITARLAASQGKEVFSVPGNLNSLYSQGTNELIKDGAIICTDISDIIQNIPILNKLTNDQRKIEKVYEHLTDVEKSVIDSLRLGPLSTDQICLVTGLGAVEVNITLSSLEIKDYICSCGQGTFNIK